MADYKRLLASLCYIGIIALLSTSPVHAADPDPLQDFCVALPTAQQNVFLNGLLCKNPMDVTPPDFSSQLLRKPGNTANSMGSSVTLASAGNFPGLNTQGLSYARIDFAAGGVVPPHNHPRASEVTFVEQGTLYVGFVDTNNTLFAQTLYPGDLFVFPRGLVHFLINVGKTRALSLSALNSQNPGATILPTALFAANPPISEQVLEKSFDLSAEELKSLRAQLGGAM